MYADVAHPSLRAYDPSSLRHWGYRVGTEARDAIWLSRRLLQFSTTFDRSENPILRYFHATGSSHAFRAQSPTWMRLTETQATKGIAAQLLAGGPSRVLAFLRALAPETSWPGTLERVEVTAEAKSEFGRADLVVIGHAEDRVWGTVIEAKFDHHMYDNPLSNYYKLGKSLGMQFVAGPFGPASAVLRVMGKVEDRSVRDRLRSNKTWKFVHWSGCLRRLERELNQDTDDMEFQMFRNALWKRIL